MTLSFLLGILYGAAMVVVAVASYRGVHIPVITPLARGWRRVAGTLGGNRLNDMIWAWQDRRRAARLLPLAERLDGAGMQAQADLLRRAARPTAAGVSPKRDRR